MSLERKDVRGKIDPGLHEALLAICDAKGITQAEFVESLVVPEIKRLLHEAHDIAARTRSPGTSGKNRESSGEPANHGRRR